MKRRTLVYLAVASLAACAILSGLWFASDERGRIILEGNAAAIMDIFGGLLGLLIGLLVALCCLALYILPLILASRRKHPQFAPICVVNIFMGWTLIGWVVALAWAVAAVGSSPSAAGAGLPTDKSGKSE